VDFTGPTVHRQAGQNLVRGNCAGNELVLARRQVLCTDLGSLTNGKRQGA
jgi:hypothetical protein